jgi:EMC6
MTKLGALLDKVAKGKSITWEKDDILDAVHWLRQLASVLLGLMWGIASFTGLVALLAYGVSISAVLVAFASVYLGVDEECVDRWTVVKEGFMSGFAAFLVCWIVAYQCVIDV